MQILVHTFRHYLASNLYRKTKILKTVQDALGHKSIMNTEIYTKMVVFREEEYYSATAKTLEEVCKLAEDGWSFFAEIDGIKVFRKPK
jgi:integrase